MKIYIAAMSKNQAQAIALRDKLEAGDHFCTASWLLEDMSKPLSDAAKGTVAFKDVLEVQASDLVILLAETEPVHVPGGKHVEVGVALGSGIPVYVVGPPENVFHYHPLVERFSDIDDLLSHLIADDYE